jgi:hypothetical protein
MLRTTRGTASRHAGASCYAWLSGAGVSAGFDNEHPRLLGFVYSKPRLVCISYLDRIAACVLGYLTYRQQNVLLSINASETSLIYACPHFAGRSDSKSFCETECTS